MTLPQTETFASAEALAEDLAGRILEGVAEAAAHGRSFLLGCPSGRTPKPVYDAMAARLAAAPRTLSHLVLVMMDEFMEGAEGANLCPGEAHYSCRRYAEMEIRRVLNAGLPNPALHLTPDRVWFPDPRDPGAFDRRIAEAGGVDLFLLAMGASDGHVAFNPPGTGADSESRIVALAEETRQDNLGTFPDFRSVAEVPTRGVTVGLGTIAEASRAVAMVVTGAHKGAALRRLLDSPDFDPSWPATIVHRCRGARILVDRAAGDAACR